MRQGLGQHNGKSALRLAPRRTAFSRFNDMSVVLRFVTSRTCANQSGDIRRHARIHLEAPVFFWYVHNGLICIGQQLGRPVPARVGPAGVAGMDSAQPAPVASAFGFKPRSSRCYAWRLSAPGSGAGRGRERPPPAG